jgi:hypothetical protein
MQSVVSAFDSCWRFARAEQHSGTVDVGLRIGMVGESLRARRCRIAWDLSI